MKNIIILLSIGLISSATFANNGKFNQFVPQGFNLLETHCQADFNKDGKKDCVLLIKDTKKSAWKTVFMVNWWIEIAVALSFYLKLKMAIKR